MPHTPGNTPASWRRQFYGDIGHGAKVLNLFEFRPVQAAYTENHVSAPAMYQEVRKGLHELGKFEDIMQDGQVRPAKAALWFSETADVWDDHERPFDAAKRGAVHRHPPRSKSPLDFVVDGDDLKAYKVALPERPARQPGGIEGDRRLGQGRRPAVRHRGGRHVRRVQPAEQGAARTAAASSEKELEEAKEVIRFEKQDLPFAKPVAHEEPIPKLLNPVFGVRSKIELKGASILHRFEDKLPAATVNNKAGKGQAYYVASLPGLSYFKPALPRRPVDRGATDDSMAHFIPHQFKGACSAGTLPVVSCSERLVENTVIQAKQGTVISLINWSGAPQKDLRVTVFLPVPTKQVSLASGGAVKTSKGDLGSTVFTLDLDVADALILR